MKATYKRRLLNVARALRESPDPKKFDMNLFCYADCGTPACALGHYAARRDLQRTFKIWKSESFELHWVDPTRGGEGDNYDAAMRHFNINNHQYDALFGANGCGGAKTAVQAARFIERFARTGELP